MTTTTDLTVAVWPGHRAAAAAAGRRGLRGVPRRRRLSTARRCGSPARARSTCPACSAVAARRSRWPSSCAPCATTAVAAGGSGGGRQRRGGRTGVDQGPVAAAPPPASGARRAAAGGADGRRPSARYVYVSDPARRRGCRDGARRGRPATSRTASPISVVTVEPGYVAGEETAAVRALNGGPAKPTDKPPRPFEEGVGGPADAGQQCRDAGQSAVPAPARRGGLPQPGHVDVAGHVSGDDHRGGRPPALYEIPHGLAFTDLLALHGVSGRSGARRADGRLLRRPAEPRHARRHARPRDACAASAAGSAAARSRSSPTTARSPSPHR